MLEIIINTSLTLILEITEFSVGIFFIKYWAFILMLLRLYSHVIQLGVCKGWLLLHKKSSTDSCSTCEKL